MNKVDLSIVIVNWKVRDLLEKCLDSIFRYQGDYKIEVLVVDNDSQDGSPEMIMTDYQDVVMISLPTNIGFAAANNLAIKQASADNIFLLNPDSEITEDFFPKIFQYLAQRQNIEVLGPHIINPDGSTQQSIRRLPDLWSQIMVLLKLIKIFPNNKFLKKYLYTDFDYTKEQSVDQIMGAAMLIPKEIFDKLGYFDENFFVWFEEVDFCQRVKKAQFNIRYTPDIKIIHQGGKSFSKKGTLKKQWIFDKSLLYYFLKHKNIFSALVILLFIPINLLLTFFYAIFIKK